MKDMYDVIIIGGGPAGLSAAIYLARARYRVLVVEKENFGGQITITAQVVNYPGTGEISGAELTENMRRQAEAFGAEFLFSEVTRIDTDKDIKTVSTSRGDLKCFGVLLATGAHPRAVGFKGEQEFKGHGVAYCATCDGEFFTGKHVFVIGGGFAAAEESVFLTKYAKSVTILIRGDDFKCAKSAADEARNNEKITVVTNVEVLEASGDNIIRKLIYKNRLTGETTVYEAPNNEIFGVFVFAGYEPATDLVKGIADINEQGYVITDSNQKTSVDGLYAAGDVCVKKLRQVVTATADGAIAATELEKYAAAMQEKTGIIPKIPDNVKDEKQNKNEAKDEENELFTPQMLDQLNTVFSKMQNKLLLKLYLDDTALSSELKRYMYELAKLTDKLSIEEITAQQQDYAPCVRVCSDSGEWLGLAFHGVPGGHEFTSFVLGLYNASGSGQSLDEQTMNRIKAIDEKKRLRILVSLSCTMCPELVIAAQKIASENELVEAEVFDINHYPDLKQKYNVMSVPCLVINEEKTAFGKKNIKQLLDII